MSIQQAFICHCTVFKQCILFLPNDIFLRNHLKQEPEILISINFSNHDSYALQSNAIYDLRHNLFEGKKLYFILVL